jgi:two-component system, LytTR family, response regulator
MLSTVIIDNEEIAIHELVDLLNKLSSFEIKVIGIASNLNDGVALIKKTRPDIVFLDVNIPGKNGLEIFNEFKHPYFKIIFCTADPNYAIAALKHSASGYLLKPVDFFELREALQKVSKEFIREQQRLQLEDQLNILSTPEMSGEYIMVAIENGFILENSRNIEYCYANQSYSIVVKHTKTEILVTKSLKELQEILPENQFYRTHKSFLVNIFYIRKFVHAKESYVLLKSGVKIPVSVRVTSSITNDIKNKFDSLKKIPALFPMLNIAVLMNLSHSYCSLYCK